MNTLHYRVTVEISEVILTQSAPSSRQTEMGRLHLDRKEKENPNARVQKNHKQALIKMKLISK